MERDRVNVEELKGYIRRAIDEMAQQANINPRSIVDRAMDLMVREGRSDLAQETSNLFGKEELKQRFDPLTMAERQAMDADPERLRRVAEDLLRQADTLEERMRS